MHKLFFILSSVLLFNSCQEKAELIETIKEVSVETSMIADDTFNYDTLKGIYTGDFAGSQIRIILNYISQSNAIGYNIHKGLQRNINGKVLKSEDTIYLTLSEPGDHEYDGIFNLAFIGEDQNPTGFWVCNNSEIKPKEFTLSKVIVPPFDFEELTSGNFTNYFGFVSDSIGSYSFEDDGFVAFEYYPVIDDENRIEQLIEIRGTWSLKDAILTIDWQENSLFTDKKESFEILQTEYQSYYLKNEDRTLDNYYF